MIITMEGYRWRQMPGWKHNQNKYLEASFPCVHTGLLLSVFTFILNLSLNEGTRAQQHLHPYWSPRGLVTHELMTGHCALSRTVKRPGIVFRQHCRERAELVASKKQRELHSRHLIALCTYIKTYHAETSSGHLCMFWYCQNVKPFLAMASFWPLSQNIRCPESAPKGALGLWGLNVSECCSASSANSSSAQSGQ